eukprot:3938442-Rhodomonas_salina.2
MFASARISCTVRSLCFSDDGQVTLPSLSLFPPLLLLRLRILLLLPLLSPTALRREARLGQVLVSAGTGGHLKHWVVQPPAVSGNAYTMKARGVKFQDAPAHSGV